MDFDLIELVQSYSYGQLNLLDDDFEIFYDGEKKQLFFDKFYTFDKNNQFGACHEISENFQSQLKRENSEYYAFVVPGNYSGYGFDCHSFNIVANREKVKSLLNDKAKIAGSDFKNLDARLVDVSLGCVDCNFSKYRIDRWEYENQVSFYNGHKLFLPGMSVPLIKIGEYLVNLRYSEKYSNKLGLAIFDEQGYLDDYDINSRLAHSDARRFRRQYGSTKETEFLLDVIELLRHKELIEVDTFPKIPKIRVD